MKNVAIPFILVLYLCIINNGWSQANQPPNLTATGDQFYCPLSQINVATSFNIVDPDDTEIEALFIQISTGYVNGQDQLLLTGNHPNVISSWNALEGKLSLTGAGGVNVSYIDLIAAVGDVVFQSNSPNVSGEKFFSFTVGDANYLPSTDHYYEYVPSQGITWSQARTAAASRTYFGLQGYLVTVTSAEEAQLTGEQAQGTGWIGASDEEIEGTWKWMTGPEAGSTFWFGLGNGTTMGADIPYENWNNTLGNEPNNVGGEDYAHIVSPNLVSQGLAVLGTWNDLPNAGTSGDYFPQGYIVEYGGLPGDPVLTISTSTKISTASITGTIDADLCGPGSVILEATASQGDVVWFDALTGGNQVHTGNSFTTPFLNTTTSYYVIASVNGCLDGERTEVVATIKTIPVINSVVDALICDDGLDTLSASASAGTVNWYDAPTGGTLLGTGNFYTTPTVTTTTTYYVDATDDGCTTGTRTPVTLTVQKTALPTGELSQTFCDINNASVADLVLTGTDVLWYATNTGTTPLSLGDLLTTGTYYATQTINTCESLSRLAVDVIIHETIMPLVSTDIPVLEVCDNNLDGDDTNGIAEFDLTIQEPILLNGKSSADFSFEYYIDSGYTSLVPNKRAFQSMSRTVYVRMMNNNDTACYTDTSFNIQVNPLPNVIPSMVFKNCDEDGTPDGLTDFNLNEANAVITSENLTNLNITYHLSLMDAQQDINDRL